MAKIICVGSVNVDITGYCFAVPEGGETLAGDFVKTSPGGKGSNQSVAAHMAGSNVTLISKMGNDAMSGVLVDFYASVNMPIDHISRTDTAGTGIALIMVESKTAQNRVLIIPGANLELDASDAYANEEEFKNADIVICQLETTFEPIMAAAELAKKYNKPFVLNPAPYKELPNKLWNMIDYITPNESEAREFTGVEINNIDDARKAAEILLSRGVKNVIITLGVNGVFFKNAEFETHVDAIRMKAIDTTGAGDAFNGGFITAIGEGKSIEEALRFATCTSAISVTRKGAAASMPSRAEIDELYSQHFN